MAGVSDLKMKTPKGQPAGDGALLLLLSLNFVLLAFFLMLNSMATYQAEHASKVLAKVREGYNIQGPMEEGSSVPWAAKSPWQEETAERVQGMVVNRLKLDTVPLEVDAKRVVMTFSPGQLFDAGGRLVVPELVENVRAAAGKEAVVTWEILVPSVVEDGGLVARELASLAKVAGKAALRTGGDSVRAVILPGPGTRPETGATLQTLGAAAGAADVRGEADVKAKGQAGAAGF